MGVNSGGDLLYRLKNLTLIQLMDIATSRAAANGRSVPRVDMDANWLVRKFFGAKGAVAFGLIAEVESAFVQEGAAVNNIFDGDKRPNAKLASIVRRTKVEYARINAVTAKGTVMQLSQRLQDGEYADNDEKVRLTKELASEEKYLRKCENEAKNVSYPEHYDMLKDAVGGIVDTSNKGGSIEMIAKALYEADYAIAYRAIRGETDIIVANDFDYKVAVGDSCLAVNDFKYDTRNKTIKDIELTSGCRKTIEDAASVAGIHLDDKEHFVAAEYPMLDGASSAMRALVAVGLGCDTLPGGVAGLGVKKIDTMYKFLRTISAGDGLVRDETSSSPADTTNPSKPSSSPETTASKTSSPVRRSRRNVKSTYRRREATATAAIDSAHINSSNEAATTTGDEMADRLLKWYVEKDAKKRSREVLWTCAQAILYQPGNIVGVSPPQPLLYLHGSPPYPLPKYIKEYYANPYELAEDRPETALCQGNGICGQHLYMRGDGFYTCSSCKDVFCRHCVQDVNKRENRRRRKNKEKVLPPDYCCTQCCSIHMLASGKEDISVWAMKEQLAKQNVTGLDNASPSEVIFLYESIVEKKNTDFYSAAIESEVKFPLLPATSLDDGTLTTILSFDFEEGARVLRNEALSNEQLVKLVDLFATLLHFESSPPKHLSRIAKVLPKIIMDFADKSRADNGLRLMERCIRHAMDSKTTSLVKASAEIFEYDGEIGLSIRHTMPPSFKDGEYQSEVAFTKSSIVACSCSCKAGADCSKGDKHLDVLPILYLLVLLLYDGLAEHMLVELASRWKAADDNIDDKEVMMDAIETVKRAAHRGSSVVETRPSDATISKLLDGFLVGTERPKKTPAPPHPRQLCPLAAQKLFVSFFKKGELATSQTGTELDNDYFAEARKKAPFYNRLSSDPESTTFISDESPKYFKTECMAAAWIKAQPSDDKSYEESVGYSHG